MQDDRFQKGQSGNPKGKPKGTGNRTTIIAQELLGVEAETLVRKVVQMAMDSDLTCLRICLERLVPPKKDAPIEMDIPEISTIDDIPKLLAAIAAKLGEGGITPSEAVTLIALVEAFRKSLELVELKQPVTVTKSLKRGAKSPLPPFTKGGGGCRVFSWFKGVPKGHEKLSRKVPFLSFQGVPKGHEELSRKDLMGCAPLQPSYGSTDLFMASGCPEGT